MITKDKFNELGYELKENWLSNIDLIENDNFTIEINYDKKKILYLIQMVIVQMKYHESC